MCDIPRERTWRTEPFGPEHCARRGDCFQGPAGEIKIDANRNGVGTTYITEVTKAPDGSFYNKVVKTVPNISQTLGLPEADFKKMGLGSRDVPDCRK